MTNLLPRVAQETIRREWRMRTLIVAMTMFLIAIVCGTALLVPSVLLSDAKEREALKRSDIVEQSVALRQAQGVADQARALQSVIGLLELEEHESSLFDRLRAILTVRPQGVLITNIFFNADGGETMTIEGNAATRDVLVRFRDAVNVISGVAKVEVPLSDLAPRTDSAFSLTVSFLVRADGVPR